MSTPISPWPRPARRAVASSQALGLVLLLVAALAPASSDELSRQVLWLNVGVLGLAVAAAGQAGWLIVGRRTVGHRRRQIVPDVRR